MRSRAYANLGKEQEAALLNEINRQIDLQMDGIIGEILAASLLTLHEEYGFGQKRLEQFSERFCGLISDMDERYRMKNKREWICMKKLADKGLNVEKLFGLTSRTLVEKEIK